MNARTLCSFLLLTCFLWGCAKPPRQELVTAQAALARAEAAEAPALATEEYRAASNALRDGEALIRRKQYQLARQILPLAESHAQKALIRARQEQVAREQQKAREREEQRLREEQALLERLPPEPKPIRPPPPSVKAPAPAPTRELPVSYRVRGGETLWTIAARKDVYADALLWPLLYQANRDQIKDPRQIYPGQTLSIPRQISDQSQQEARQRARESKIFFPAP